MYKRILGAVNEFSNSTIAARYAIALAKSCQAKLSLVYAAEDKIGKDIFKDIYKFRYSAVSAAALFIDIFCQYLSFYLILNNFYLEYQRFIKNFLA
ncbi:MAG: universal stress protein [Nitrospirae bacterium]|jgi:hypothetical protein|nr:universal stress protein [Nitrospirota bacterium]